MVKNLLMILVILLSFLAADVFAEDVKTASGSTKTVVSEEDKDAKPTPIDTEDVKEEGEAADADDTEDQGVPGEESYDTNTGLPDVVPSDKEWIQ